MRSDRPVAKEPPIAYSIQRKKRVVNYNLINMAIGRSERGGFEKYKTKTRQPIAVQGFYMLVGDGGFEPPKSLTTDLQSAPFGRSGNPPY